MKYAAVLSALVLALSGTAPGQTISFPLNMSNTVHDSRWAQCAFGPDSVLHIIWQERYLDAAGSDILYIRYDGTTVSDPVKLKNSPDVHAERPYIAVNTQGMIAVVWDSEKYIWCRVFDPQEQRWLPAERVSGPAEYAAEEPSVALDGDGNVYVYYYTGEPGAAWVRSKVNGVWEEKHPLSHPDVRAQNGMIAAAPDGTIWVVWTEKGEDGNYKAFYSRRKKDTSWRQAADVNFSGQSQALPHIAVGKDNVPRVVWMHEFQENPAEHWNIEIVFCTLDEKVNPLETITPSGIWHFPRVAVDSGNEPHVAIQDGAGDQGAGIFYTHKSWGAWKPLYEFPNSFGHPKLPGISADAFGNVAVVWASYLTTHQQEVWLSTLQPVIPKPFLPPSNTRVDVSAQRTRSLSQVGYTLSWERNPANLDEYLEGYSIYVKEGRGAWSLVQTVSNSTFSYETGLIDMSLKSRFGIRTRSRSGAESALVEF